MSGPAGGRPLRVRQSYVDQIAERLGARDLEIVALVNRFRLMTSHQLEALVFTDNSPQGRAVVRGRVLRRLVGWRVVTALPRRIGGNASGGSAATVYALDSVGRTLLAQHQALDGLAPRVRTGMPGERTIQHTVAVAQLYTDLVVNGREADIAVPVFEAEPACWWPLTTGGFLKPDAYFVLAADGMRDHWWAEVDKATESVPTLRRKLVAYLDFFEGGQDGPRGVMPRVLVTVPTVGRLRSVARLLTTLPDPADRLFLACLESEAARHLFRHLKE